MDESFLKELFEPFGDVDIRRMFGATAVFHRGVSIAMYLNDEFGLKADEETCDHFIEEGQKQFQYTYKSGRKIDMGYWTVPERLLDDPAEFTQWANRAFEAAQRADAKKPPAKRKLKSL